MTSGPVSSLRWQKRADFAALVAWLAASAFMALSAFALFGEDFRDFHAAARVLLAGGDVYDFRQVADMMQASAGFARYNPFYYPPWFALLMTPFGLLPYSAARLAWALTNVILWGLGLAALTAALDWPRPGGWGGRWGAYLLATLLFAWVTWRYEQLGILMFALVSGALWAIRVRRDRLAGVLLALLLTKPTIGAVAAAAVLLWLLRQRRWQGVLAFGLSLAVLLVLSAPWLPAYLQRLRDPEFARGLAYVLDAQGGIVKIRINTTLKDWLASFNIQGWPFTLTYALSAAAWAAILAGLAWRRASLAAVAAAGVVAGLWLAPYALQYDYPSLTLALFYGLRGLGQRRGWVRWAGAALVAAALSVLISPRPRPISDGYGLTLAVAALLALLAVTRTEPAPGLAAEAAQA